MDLYEITHPDTLMSNEYSMIVTFDSKDKNANQSINSITYPNQFDSNRIYSLGLMEYNFNAQIYNVNPYNNTFTITQNSVTQNITIPVGKYSPVMGMAYASTYLGINTDTQSPATAAQTLYTRRQLREEIQFQLRLAFGDNKWVVDYNVKTSQFTIYYDNAVLPGNSFTLSNISAQGTVLHGLSNSSSSAQTFLTAANTNVTVNAITGGYASMLYTRYIDILSGELLFHTIKGEMSSKRYNNLIQRIPIYANIQTDDTNTYVFSHEIRNIVYAKYIPTQKLGVVNIQLMDEYGLPLYVPNTTNSNYIMNFMCKVL